MDLQDKEHQSVLERVKFDTDYLKHLTILSTGSIVLIAAFAEKLSTKPFGSLCYSRFSLWHPLISDVCHSQPAPM